MNMPAPKNRRPLKVIAGPTASGKTALALDMAERIGGTIINADASQVYRDLRILSARPSAEEEARVPHLLFGYRDGADACSAADWAADAARAVAQVHREGGVPILVGGTGLYLRTLLDGIAPVPDIDPAIRADVRALSSREAHAALAREDPESAARLHVNDTARTHRALEVVRATGRTIGAWRAARVGGIGDSVISDVTLLDPPVAELYARCDRRFRAMIDAGAIDEVASLVARNLDPALPVMRAIGVPEISAYLRGDAALDDVVAAGAQATRNYAKRQRTWFRNQKIGDRTGYVRIIVNAQ